MLFQTLSLIGRTYTVDNTPGTKANFTDVQTAHDNVNNGDTLIIMPSYNRYSANLNCTKKLYIYSRGPHGQKIDPDKRPILNGINFYTGSSGSVLNGLCIQGNSISINVNNIIIESCFFEGIRLVFNNSGSTSSSLIHGNVFWNVKSPQNAIELGAAVNTIIRNNYFISSATNYSWPGPALEYIRGGNSSNLFTNNLIVETVIGTGSHYGGGHIYFRNSSMKIYNNIIWTNVSDRTRFDTTSTGATYKNNITYSARNKPTPLADSSNFNDTMPVFETTFSNSSPMDYVLSYDFRLKSTSIGKNAGTDSTDIGLYGGGYAFDLLNYGFGVPVIEDFEVKTPVVKQGGTLRVRLRARKPSR